MDTQTMWVDSDRCMGCGACVEVCPAGAIALVEGKARVDEETCIGRRGQGGQRSPDTPPPARSVREAVR